MVSAGDFRNGVTFDAKMNLIPCRRDHDGVLGLRDEVTGKFYTNAGTGTFAAG